MAVLQHTDRLKGLQVQVFITDISTNVICGCGISVLGDAQKLPGHGPGELALGGPA